MEVNHDDEHADLPRVRINLCPKVFQADPTEVLVPVQSFIFLLVQPHRMVQHLIALISAEAAEYPTQQLFSGIRVSFEVQFELFKGGSC